MKRLHMLWILIAALLLAGSAGWGYLWLYASRDTVPGGITAAADAGAPSSGQTVSLSGFRPIALGGMKIDDALNLLQSRTSELESLTVTIEANAADSRNETWTLSELGVTVDTKEAASAISRLREGGLWDKAKYRFQFPERLELHVSWDKEAFTRKIRGQWGYIDADEPVNATRTITDDDTVVYTPHTDAYRLDTEGMLAKAEAEVKAYLAERWGAGDSGADNGDAKTGGSGAGTGGAKTSDTGAGTGGAKTSDTGAGNGGEKTGGIKLPLMLHTVHPPVTLERLKAEGIERKIAEFTTDFSTSAAGRAYNVTVTAKTLNDWDLAPGEVFDYGKIISLTEDKYGYREAPVILNGKLVPGIGGGICQVSSTLYNAALYAGLDMVERRNHSLPVSYLPVGRDATFAEGAINFRFKNNTGKHLIIRTAVKDKKLTVKLFGTMPENVSYTLDSNTVKVIEPPVKEVISKAVPAGSRLLVTSGKPGYVVETYRTKLVDGAAVSRVRISRDTYKAQPAVYSVAPGTAGAQPDGSGDGSGQPLLEDGVSGVQ